MAWHSLEKSLQNLFTTLGWKSWSKPRMVILEILKIKQIIIPSSDGSISVWFLHFHFITQSLLQHLKCQTLNKKMKSSRHSLRYQDWSTASNSEDLLKTGLTVIKRFISSFTLTKNWTQEREVKYFWTCINK